jgi:enoyl-CoA hydratase
MTTSTEIRREDVDGIITVTFTRDDKLNAVSPLMFDTLAQAVVDLAAVDQRVLVITAEGRYFTSGLDLAATVSSFGDVLRGEVSGSRARRLYRQGGHHDLFDEIEQIEKPVVLAAQSHCVGVGVELGVSCDFRLASTTTTFRLPEVPALGVLPGSGGISRLTRLVGPHWARWLAMAGKTIDAGQALAIGLVHEVYPADMFVERVRDFARDLVSLPPEAMGLAKVAIDVADGVDRATARKFDRLAQSTLMGGEESRAILRPYLGGNDNERI